MHVTEGVKLTDGAALTEVGPQTSGPTADTHTCGLPEAKLGLLQQIRFFVQKNSTSENQKYAMLDFVFK